MPVTVSIPDDMATRIEGAAGEGCLESFVLEAAEERLRRLERLAALEAVAGSRSAEDFPEWSTPEKISAWVRRIRQEADYVPPEGSIGPPPDRYFDAR